MNSSELKATAKLIEKMVGRINAKDNEIARYHGLLDQERCHRDQERNAAKETLAAVVKNREEFMEEIAALKEKCAGLAADARYHENISLSISASCDKHHTNKSSAETEIAALKQERDDLKKAIEGTDRVRSDLAASYKREIGALKAERDDLRQIVEMVHSDLGIKPGDHIGQAISYIKTQVSGWRGSYTEMERVALAFKKEVERLQGIKPEFPPREGRGEGLPRYGLRWNGPDQPVATPMDDGFWVPWHLAQKEVERIKAAFKAEASERDEAVKELRESTQENKTLSAEVESLRAKLASRTVDWPEWAKEGTRVRMRSRECSFQNHWASIGDELTIVGVDRARWIAMTARGEIDVRDLEPVAEHVAPPVVVATQSATQTPEETAPVVSPKVGDKVRLIKRPSTADYDGRQWDYTWGETGEIAVVNYVGLCVNVIRANGLKNDWPLSCVEVVK